MFDKSLYESPRNMPKLRYHYRRNSIKGLFFSLSISAVVTAFATYAMYHRKIVTTREFYESYDPDAEWARLRDSGILKTVNKDGTFVNLYD
ncbi:unnamed protein product [Hymenolepis diminuta]|uniref:Uncharacterized protein n=1 Tax=Hymenolepis diminuta TaxID=6216 RepID=A0A564YJ64_HYMDI|nr:unnamed protein product [Hymenolepis diminuta]